MNWSKIKKYLKALGITLIAMVALQLIWKALGWESEFLIGWLSCMVWFLTVESYGLRKI